MEFKYGLDERPPLILWILFGLQWLAVGIPTIIILGKVVAAFHFSVPGAQVTYLQKLCFVMGIGILFQVLWGHRLPIIIGPSSILLVGVIASQGFDLDTIYTSILVGGMILAFLSITGLFTHLQKLFTPRVVAVVLLLVAFTMTPAMQRLITGGIKAKVLPNLFFALIFIFAMFAGQRCLTGIWKSTLIVWAMLFGSLAYFLLFPQSLASGEAGNVSLFSGFFSNLTIDLSLDPGVLISFLFCFLALLINDLGSIQSLSEILKPSNMPQRITRGITLTGLTNVLSGFLGVIGSVNYSISAGVIISTGNASRFTLAPAALLLVLLSFSPATVGFIGRVPSVITGSVLLYVLCAQVATALTVVFESEEGFQFYDGLVLGLPILLGTIIAFLPPEATGTFPTVLRPILGNGFVVGVITALILEHFVFKD